MLRWGNDERSLTDSVDLTAPGVTLSSTYSTSLFTKKPPAATPHVFTISAPKRNLKLAFGDVHNRNSWFRALSTPGTPHTPASKSTKLAMPERVQLKLRVLQGSDLSSMNLTGSSDPYMQFWVCSPPSLEARAEVVGFVDAGDDRVALRKVMPDAAARAAMAAQGVPRWSVSKAGKSKHKLRQLNPEWNETFNLHMRINDVSPVGV